MFDINKIMSDLVKERPLFHSEADFQFALAWKIQNTYREAKIRLEKSVRGLEGTNFKDDKNRYIDILVTIDDKEIPIELKYKTRNNSKEPMKFENEEYNLKNQGAQDNGRYDFLKDISRIEKFINSSSPKSDYGYAIILTNDHLYYESGENSNSSQFRIDKNIKIIESGKHDWNFKSDSFKKYNPKRIDAINLINSYNVEWQDCSTLLDDKDNKFKYLIVTITK